MRNPVAAFAGMMVKMDEGVGQILDLLSELKIDGNTIVLLSSDNGPHKEGGHKPEVFNSNGGLRGFKRDLYEGGVRAPLLARWPGRIKAGTQSKLISAHWDMLPTFCELAGAQTPKDVDGISLLPTLLNGKQRAHDYLYWEFYERGGRRAARFGDWKAVQLNVHKNANEPIEIYNLAIDVAEQTNVSRKHPEIVQQAKQIFQDAHRPSEHWQFRSLTKK